MPDSQKSPAFPTTSWTMISAAGHAPSAASEALNHVCAAYWFPVYAFIRRRGHSREQAEDLCQSFFAQILQSGAIGNATRERGRFRSFLLASVTNFLANEWDRSHAAKRGGGAPQVSLDFADGEKRYCNEPRDDLTPQALYEREWALALIDAVLERLRAEYQGRENQFEALKSFLTGDQDRGGYDRLSQDLQISNVAARTAVHRLRRRYGELIRAELASLLTEPDDIDGEIQFLLAALGTR